jgi:DNA topoisomerase VI subunit A
MTDTVRSKILTIIEQMCSSCIEHVDCLPTRSLTLTVNGQHYQWNDKIDDRDRRDFTRYVYILSIVHRLVRTNSRMNMRELFYSQVNLFHHQRISDSIVEHIAQHLSVDRRRLGFVATAKGLCAGVLFDHLLFDDIRLDTRFQVVFPIEIYVLAI